MLETMLESRRPRSRSVGQALVSLTLHAGIITGVVSATMAAPADRPGGPVAREIAYVAPLREIPAARTSEPAEIPEAPALPTFQTVEAPLSIPTTIPPLELAPPLDPTRFTGVGVESPLPAPASGAVSSGAGATVLSAAQVDQAAMKLSGTDPRYPVVLRAAGIEGRILVEFVVDGEGRVEPETWRVLQTSEPAFAEAARVAVLTWRFSPALVRGRPVRQLVRLPVTFSLSA